MVKPVLSTYMRDIKANLKYISVIVITLLVGFFWIVNIATWIMDFFFPVIPVVEDPSFISRLFGYIW